MQILLKLFYLINKKINCTNNPITNGNVYRIAVFWRFKKLTKKRAMMIARFCFSYYACFAWNSFINVASASQAATGTALYALARHPPTER